MAKILTILSIDNVRYRQIKRNVRRITFQETKIPSSDAAHKTEYVELVALCSITWPMATVLPSTTEKLANMAAYEKTPPFFPKWDSSNILPSTPYDFSFLTLNTLLWTIASNNIWQYHYISTENCIIHLVKTFLTRDAKTTPYCSKNYFR